jgi:pimeloyl-ACP methyl ester carboxylesterase
MWSHPTCRDSGFSDAPDRKRFRYTFENLAKVIDSQTIGLKDYAIYVFDYGAPVGLRLALAHPERITAIISQNGNAYEEGLSQGWNPIQRYWKEPTPRIALLSASSSRLKRPNGNTCMASRTRR